MWKRKPWRPKKEWRNKEGTLSLRAKHTLENMLDFLRYMEKKQNVTNFSLKDFKVSDFFRYMIKNSEPYTLQDFFNYFAKHINDDN